MSSALAINLCRCQRRSQVGLVSCCCERAASGCPQPQRLQPPVTFSSSTFSMDSVALPLLLSSIVVLLTFLFMAFPCGDELDEKPLVQLPCPGQYASEVVQFADRAIAAVALADYRGRRS
jgi:hypothetical protein